MKKPLKLISTCLLMGHVLINSRDCTAIPIPQVVKEVVTFVFVQDANGRLVPNGTAFFVGVDNPATNGTALYMITAKHVLTGPDRKSLLPGVFLRLNKQGGEPEMIPVPLFADGPRKNVFFHSDPTVDIAVVLGTPSPDKYVLKLLPASFLTTREDFKKLDIGEGDDVFFTGLFLAHLGEHKNYPVVRFGKVALLTDEKVEWAEQEINGTNVTLKAIKTDLYLIEAVSTGGNSGSPVFFDLGGQRKPNIITAGGPRLKLAGIMKGFFGEPNFVQFVDTSRIEFVRSNLGIAAVVPAYLLHEILFSEEQKALRKF